MLTCGSCLSRECASPARSSVQTQPNQKTTQFGRKRKSAPLKRRNFSGRGNVHRVEGCGLRRAQRAEAIRRLGAGGTPQNLAKTMRNPSEDHAKTMRRTRCLPRANTRPVGCSLGGSAGPFTPPLFELWRYLLYTGAINRERRIDEEINTARGCRDSDPGRRRNMACRGCEPWLEQDQCAGQEDGRSHRHHR